MGNISNVALFAFICIFPHNRPTFSLNNSINGTFEIPDDKEPSNVAFQLYKCPKSNISEDKIYQVPELLLRPGTESNLTINIKFTEKAPACSPDTVFDFVLALELAENITVFKDKYLLSQHQWFFTYYNGTYSESISPERYCISSLDENDKFIVKYCRSDCGQKPCISKCCHAHEVYNMQHGTCDEIDITQKKWTTTVDSAFGRKHSFVHYNMECDESNGQGIVFIHPNTSLNYGIKREFKITEKGSVLFRKGDDTWTAFAEGSYCLDGAAIPASADTEWWPDFSGNSSDTMLYVCLPRPKSGSAMEESQEEFLLYKVLVPFSTVFIGLTVIVYFLTWPEQTIHGYTVFLYLITLFCLYVFLIITSIPEIIYPKKNPELCAFMAAAIHYSYLSSICWLTSISFDVWRNFKLIKIKVGATAVRQRGKRRLVIFCFFSFGYPLLQVGACALIDALHMNVSQEDVSVILPRYGRGHRYCTLSDDGITYYMYLPIGVLLGSNIALFCLTLLNITDSRKSIRDAFAKIAQGGNNNNISQSFGSYVRLFIIMGIFWIAQLVAWFVRVWKKDEHKVGLDIINSVIDSMTVLQAVIIFYIFVCKTSIFRALYHLHPWLRPFLNLWIRGGCCTLPPPNVISRGSTTLSRKATMRSRLSATEINRNSKDSDSSILKQHAKRSHGLSEEERKSSVTSNSTNVTDIGSTNSWTSDKFVGVENAETKL